MENQPDASRKASWRGQSRARNVRRMPCKSQPKSATSIGGAQLGVESSTNGAPPGFGVIEKTTGVSSECAEGRPVVQQDWPWREATVAEMKAAEFVSSLDEGVSDPTEQVEENETETVGMKKCVYPRERRVHVVDCVQPTEDDRSWWERTKDKLALFSALWCCGLESDVRDVRANDEVRQRVSAEMTTSLGLHTYMSGKDMVRRDALQQVIDSHDMSSDSCGTHRLVVVPAFISSCVVALRMKLGEGATDRRVPGNVELVKAETARLLREYNVRNADAALHQKFIIKAFFDDDTHYRVTDARARLASKSRLVRWLLSQDEKPHFDC